MALIASFKMLFKSVTDTEEKELKCKYDEVDIKYDLYLLRNNVTSNDEKSTKEVTSEEIRDIMVESSIDYIALSTFEALISLLLDTLTNMYSDVWDEYSDDFVRKKNEQLRSLSIDVVKTIANSPHAVLLSPHFCRPMIIRCGLHVHMVTIAALKSISNSTLPVEGVSGPSAIIEVIKQIEFIENKYQSVLQRCLPIELYEAVKLQLSQSVQHCSYDYLIQFMIPSEMKVVNETQEVTSNGNDVKIDLHPLLKEYLLLGNQRLGTATMRIIRLFCESGEESYTSAFQEVWFSAVQDVVLDECSVISNRSQNSTDIVEKLLELLMRARDISTCEMSGVHGCLLSADKAFQSISTRINKESYVKLSKALAVRISSLLDNVWVSQTFFVGTLSKWRQSVLEICSLITLVVNNQTSEFGHYYELLLARRLLRGRFVSIQEEEWTLSYLPALNRAAAMIEDIKSSAEIFADFRNRLLKRSFELEPSLTRPSLTRLKRAGEGSNNTANSENAKTMTQILTTLLQTPDCFQINVVSRSVWQSSWVNSQTYSTLILPPMLNVLSLEFQVFFRDKRLYKEKRFVPSVKDNPELELDLKVSSGESTKMNVLKPDLVTFWQTAGMMNLL